MHIKQNASSIYLKYNETAENTRKARIMTSHATDIMTSTLQSKELKGDKIGMLPLRPSLVIMNSTHAKFAILNMFLLEKYHLPIVNVLTLIYPTKLLQKCASCKR